MSKGNDYPCLRAWDRMMGSYQYYTDDQVEKARKDNAPQDVIYKRDSYGQDNSWVRLSEVTSNSTQWYFKQNHKDLVEKYAPEWLRK